MLPPAPPDATLRWAASALETNAKTVAIAVIIASDRRKRGLIGMDDLVALDLVSFERMACPLWTLPAQFLHPEAARLQGPYCTQVSLGATR
jgi:hypothetical protein